MALREDQILPPLDPSLQDNSDAWPEFTLNYAIGSYENDNCLVSLLNADREHPIRLEGTLDVPNHMSRRLKAPLSRGQTVIVNQIVMYSFSQFGDGSFGFWGAGRAGWYKINPARSYRKIFAEMEEAVAIFYFLADKCNEAFLPSARTPIHLDDALIDKLWAEFQGTPSCRRLGINDVHAHFRHHRRFLIKSMLEGQEEVDWPQTFVFRYFKTKFEDDLRSIEQIVFCEGDELMCIGGTAAKSEDHQSSKKSQSKVTKTSCGSSAAKTSSAATGENEMELLTKISPKSPTRQRASPTRHRKSRQLEADCQYVDYLGRSVPTTGPSAATTGTKISSMPYMDTVPPLYFSMPNAINVWNCRLDGCNHRVWDPSSVESVVKIKDHFMRHHKDERLEVVADAGFTNALFQSLENRPLELNKDCPRRFNFEADTGVFRKY